MKMKWIFQIHQKECKCSSYFTPIYACRYIIMIIYYFHCYTCSFVSVICSVKRFLMSVHCSYMLGKWHPWSVNIHVSLFWEPVLQVLVTCKLAVTVAIIVWNSFSANLCSASYSLPTFTWRLKTCLNCCECCSGQFLLRHGSGCYYYYKYKLCFTEVESVILTSYWMKHCVLTVLYELLVKARVPPADCNAAKLKPIWFRCQALFLRFIEAAMKKRERERESLFAK